MSALRLVLGDQLTRSISILRDIDIARDVVLMAEVMEEASHVPHHRQKIAFLFSAMRHFAEELRREEIKVDYVRLDDPANTGSFTGELQRALGRHGCDAIVVTEPGEWRIWQMMLDWRETLPVPVQVREDDRFFASREDFSRWATGRNQFRMEFFYREMRRKTGLLMQGDKPEARGRSAKRSARQGSSLRLALEIQKVVSAAMIAAVTAARINCPGVSKRISKVMKAK